jgi:hypothetical protein
MLAMNLLPRQVRAVNDNQWAGSGLAVDVQVELSDIAVAEFAHYENGPLLAIDTRHNEHDPRLCARATYAGDAVCIQLQRIAKLEEECARLGCWVCKSCTFSTNAGSRSKCSFCGEKRNHKLPPEGQMPGSVAAIRYKANIYLVSFHPEFSEAPSLRQWFEREMECLLTTAERTQSEDNESL